MTNIEFIFWVRERMQEYKMTQRDLALRTGFTEPSICRWLRNERRIPLKFVDKCADVFGYKLEFRRKIK